MERPILFSTPMVQAIMDGRKTQTRRIVKIPDLINEPDRFNYVGNSIDLDIPRKAIPYDDRLYHAWELNSNNMPMWVDCCPYGKAGDFLWVRESHYAYGHWTKVTEVKDGEQKVKWHFHDLTISEGKNYFYENCPPAKELIKKGRFGLGYYKRPSIFMPKQACRINLLVKDIRVERLQDISKEDAIAEGVNSIGDGTCGSPIVYENYLATGARYQHSTNGIRFTAIDSYHTLWEKINGKGSRDSNPWLWMIEFEVINPQS